MERSVSGTEKEGWILWNFGTKLHGPSSQTVAFIVTVPELSQPSSLNVHYTS
jgi:hypothetical protein